MKIAVLGTDQLAIDAYRYFEELGVQVRLLGQTSKDMTGYNFKNVEVVRVQKRFLKPDQNLEGRSRMADEFRVVFKVNATDEIERQKLENPEVFEKLGKDVLESLKNSIESFEDFDFVCFSNELMRPNYMGAANVEALNERALSDDERITYTNESLLNFDKVKECRNLCLVGSDSTNLKLLTELKKYYLEDLNKTIQFVTSEKVPFNSIDSVEYKDELNSFKELLTLDREQFEKEVTEFEEKVRNWRSLEPHIKAKTPTPAEPKPRLSIFTSAIVSSVDKLLDREGLFVTIEGSDLLGSTDQLKTLSCDRICVDQGSNVDVMITRGLSSNEEGFYSLFDMSLEEMKEDMLRFFSKQ